MGTSPNEPQPKRPCDLTEVTADGERVTSSELLRGRQQIEIEHGGELYRLRVTKAGKLILTK
jgi:hemin uptake protein HemP